MTEVRRSISAVFRHYPDARGDLRMIYNDQARIEIDQTVEALWFEIDNRRSLHAIYSAFRRAIDMPHGAVSATLFADILHEFHAARFIERQGTLTSCLACATEHPRPQEDPPPARFAECPACSDALGLVAWWRRPAPSGARRCATMSELG